MSIESERGTPSKEAAREAFANKVHAIAKGTGTLEEKRESYRKALDEDDFLRDDRRARQAVEEDEVPTESGKLIIADIPEFLTSRRAFKENERGASLSSIDPEKVEVVHSNRPELEKE